LKSDPGEFLPIFQPSFSDINPPTEKPTAEGTEKIPAKLIKSISYF